MTANVEQAARKAVSRQTPITVRGEVNAKVQEVRDLLTKLKPEIQASLSSSVPVEYLMSTLMTAIRVNPELLRCTSVSLIGCFIQANQLGLRLDGALGHAYMVPYRNTRKDGVMEAQFMPGYRGLIHLALKSPRVTHLWAGVIRDGDEFFYEYGNAQKIMHKPKLGNNGPILGVYAYAGMTGGGVVFDVLSTEEVERVRAVSKAKESGPWETNTVEMYRKTAVRRLSKYLDLTVEFARAVDLDERLDRGDVEDVTAGLLADPPAESKKKALTEGEADLPGATPDRQPAQFNVASAIQAIKTAQSGKSLGILSSRFDTLFSTGEMDEATHRQLMEAVLARMNELEGANEKQTG
jgi:recombination protein RecT